MTELQTLKAKKKSGKATPEDLTRLKQLQDGEPLSQADLDASKQREEERTATDKAAFDAKKNEAAAPLPANPSLSAQAAVQAPDTSLDKPDDHPRIAQIKAALSPFTQIEAHDSRPNEYVLFTRGISITAGDVRVARKAMQL